MKDTPEKLDQILEALPRQRAPQGFTAEVLRESRRRQDAPRSRGRVRLALAAGAAAMVVLALGVSVTLVVTERARRAELRAEIAELRAEHRRLGDEVSRLQQRSAQRVIYLGGDDTVDYVLDLERLARQRLQERAVPAVIQTAGDPGDAAFGGHAPVHYTGGAL